MAVSVVAQYQFNGEFYGSSQRVTTPELSKHLGYCMHLHLEAAMTSEEPAKPGSKLRS